MMKVLNDVIEERYTTFPHPAPPYPSIYTN